MNSPVFKFFYAVWFVTVITLSTVMLGVVTIIVSFLSPRAARYLTDVVWSHCVLTMAGIRVETIGLENLPEGEGGYILFANHTSAADIPAVGLSTGKLVSWLAKASLGKIPFFGWGLARVHMLVDRGGGPEAAKKMVAEAQARLKENQILAIFPEGTRNRSDELLLPFKKGAFILSKQTGALIVPLAIKNAGQLWPAGGFWPKPGVIRVKIGPPLVPIEKERLGDIAARAQATLHELLSDQSW